MKKTITRWQISGFIFVSILGTIFHFLFDLTDGNTLAAAVFPVNESVWEHIKLLFYPMVLYGVIEYFLWDREEENFWNIKLMGILRGILLIPVIYYTYTGILGVSADWFNIAIFFIAVWFSFLLESRIFKEGRDFLLSSKEVICILCIIAVIFGIFTFYTPNIPLFEDPITGTYGI